MMAPRTLLLMLVMAVAAIGSPCRAAPAAGAASAIGNQPVDKPLTGHAWELADQAYKAYEDGHYAQAQSKAQAAIRLRPDVLRLRLLLIYTLQQQGMAEQANVAASKAIADGLQDPVLQRLHQQARAIKAPESGTGTEAPGYSAAARAYEAYARGDYQDAIAQAQDAVLQAPADLEKQRLLTRTLASGTRIQNAQALQRLNNDVAAHPGNMDLLMQRGYLHQRLGEPAQAFADFRAARASGTAPPSVILDEGYAQAAAGDKRGAAKTLSQALDNADAGKLELNDLRRYDTRADIAGLSREWGAYTSIGYRGARAATLGLGGSPVAEPGDAIFSTAEIYWRPRLSINTPTQLLELYGRASNTLHDRGSQVEQGGGACGSAPCGSDTFKTVGGLPSTVGSLGLRYTPSTELGLTFGLQRQFNLGAATRQSGVALSDPADRARLLERYGAVDIASNYKTSAASGGWMAYVTYAFYKGTQLRTNVPSWLTAEGYVQTGYLRENSAARFRTNGFYNSGGAFVTEQSGRIMLDQAFVSSEFRLGRSIRMDSIDSRFIIYPHIVIAADKRWNKARVRYGDTGTMDVQGNGSSWSLGAGPGVTMRYWFREDHYNAVRSYLDWTIQYRYSVGGGAADRAKGLFMNFTLSY